jgi:serine protease Do
MDTQTAENSSHGTPGDDEGLGVAVEPLTPRLADRLEIPRSVEGLAVTDIDPDGAAAAAGLQAGDVIRQVNGRGVKTADELRQALKANTSGSPALFLVQRGDHSFFATIEPAHG